MSEREKEILGGRYEVVRELARGGMGRVLLAQDTVLDRPVAIKTLLNRATGKAQTRLVEEAQISGQLAHPNIITVHELGWAEDELFLVMKLVQGRDLKALLKELEEGKDGVRERYSLRRLLRLFLKMCEAMAFAHAHEVIHRDLKPANVMLDEHDDVLVMDWGLARPVHAPGHGSVGSTASDTGPRAAERSGDGAGTTGERKALSSAAREGGDAELTAEGAVLGTPAYMPPEQADATKDIDQRVDVYALGAILYHLATGKAPYKGSPAAVIQALFRGPPPAPRVVAPERNIPRGVEAIILKAMAPDRSHRYAHAGELASDVAAYLDGRATTAYRDRASEAIARLVRRHVVVIVAALAAVALAAAATVVGILAIQAERRNAHRVQTEADQAAALGVEAAEAARRTEADAATLDGAAVALARAVSFVEQSRHGIGIPVLVARHAACVAELDSAVATARALEGSSGLEAARRTLAQALQNGRRALDVALARALVARSPIFALGRLAALDLGPEGPLLEARALARDRRPAEARRVLEKATWNDRDPEARGLAAAARALGHGLLPDPTDEALVAWDEAIRGNPREAWLLLGRAECLVHRGELEKAEADYELAARLEPSDPYIWESRVRLTFVHHADWCVTQGTVNLIRFLGPELARAQLLVNRSLRGKNGGGFDPPRDVVAAANDPKTAAADRVTPLDLAHSLADESRIVHAWDLERHFAEQALAIDPKDAAALAFKADALLGGDRFDEAIALAEEAIALVPHEPLALFVKGEALRRSGHPRDAIPFLERGARPSVEPRRWNCLALACEAADDPASWERGVDAARRALSFDRHEDRAPPPFALEQSGNPELHRTLGALRRRQGKHAAAALQFLRANLLQSMHGRGEADLLAAGQELEALGLTPEARTCYAHATRDPAIKSLAEGAIARLARRR